MHPQDPVADSNATTWRGGEASSGAPPLICAPNTGPLCAGPPPTKVRTRYRGASAWHYSDLPPLQRWVRFVRTLTSADAGLPDALGLLARRARMPELAVHAALDASRHVRRPSLPIGVDRSYPVPPGWAVEAFLLLLDQSTHPLDASDLSVLSVLVLHVGAESHATFVSIPTLADATGWSERTVDRALAVLRTEGLIPKSEWEPRASGCVRIRHLLLSPGSPITPRVASGLCPEVEPPWRHPPLPLAPELSSAAGSLALDKLSKNTPPSSLSDTPNTLLLPCSDPSNDPALDKMLEHWLASGFELGVTAPKQAHARLTDASEGEPFSLDQLDQAVRGAQLQNRKQKQVAAILSSRKSVLSAMNAFLDEQERIKLDKKLQGDDIQDQERDRTARAEREAAILAHVVPPIRQPHKVAELLEQARLRAENVGFGSRGQTRFEAIKPPEFRPERNTPPPLPSLRGYGGGITPFDALAAGALDDIASGKSSRIEKDETGKVTRNDYQRANRDRQHQRHEELAFQAALSPDVERTLFGHFVATGAPSSVDGAARAQSLDSVHLADALFERPVNVRVNLLPAAVKARRRGRARLSRPGRHSLRLPRKMRRQGAREPSRLPRLLCPVARPLWPARAGLVALVPALPTNLRRPTSARPPQPFPAPLADLTAAPDPIVLGSRWTVSGAARGPPQTPKKYL